jgi:2-amino-4-hydroxy-6-hydroxymethyldihydropteridine diphosphokinase
MRIYVSIGSNVDRERNIRDAVDAMADEFGELLLSPVYDSAAVGFEGDNFLNLVAGADTELPVEEVVKALRAIEDRLGRDRSQPRYSPRSIDLDILSYNTLILDQPGIQIPRREILKNAFVLKPLRDIAGATLHPETGQSYADLWDIMKTDAPRLEVFAIDF